MSKKYDLTIDTEIKIPFNRCPLMVQMLLAMYVYEKPWLQFNSTEWNSVPGKQIRATLLKEGLINEDMVVTGRGRAWISAIVSLPYPVEHVTWVIPDTEKNK